MTKYGDETVHYDTYGNAVSYRGYTLTWAKARQLATMTDGETSLSFKYDFNGIRTKKTVNGVDTEYFYVGDTLVRRKREMKSLTLPIPQVAHLTDSLITIKTYIDKSNYVADNTIIDYPFK